MKSIISIINRKLNSKKDAFKDEVMNFLEFIKSKWYLFALLILLFLLFNNYKRAVVIGIMFILSISFGFIRRFIPIYIGIEPLYFFTISITYAIGPIQGIIFATSIIIINHIISSQFTVSLFTKIASYSLVCILAFLMHSMDFVLAAKILAIALVVINFILNLSAGYHNTFLNLPGEIIYIVFSFLLIDMAGIWVLGLLS